MIPYVLPNVLINAPTGIAWTTIPTLGSTAQAQQAEAYNMCWRATSKIEAFCTQVLRATLDSQEVVGPYRRMTVDQSTMNVRAVCDQFPVLAIASAKWTAEGVFPRVWQTITNTQYDLESSPLLSGGVPSSAGNGPSNAVFQSFTGWGWGSSGYNQRRSWRLHFQYVNGFPHAGLTSATTIASGATTLAVDDVTGFALAGWTNPANGTVWPNITATIFDGSAMEQVQIVSAVDANGNTGPSASGPGTLTLLAPGTLNSHLGLAFNLPQTQISTLPLIVQEAAIHLCCGEALIRGATATAVPSQPGLHVEGVGGKDALELAAFESLIPFKRVI